jgi:hypothetical protein
MHRLQEREPTGDWPSELRELLERRAPYVRLYVDSDDPAERVAFRRTVTALIEQGYAGAVVVTAGGDCYGAAALPDPIASTIDLDALEADYRAWFAAAALDEADPGPHDPPLEALAAAIQTLRDTCYSHFVLMDSELAPSTEIRGSIVRGIVIGEDPAQTCARILASITGDRRLWRSGS